MLRELFLFLLRSGADPEVSREGSHKPKNDQQILEGKSNE